MGDFIPPHDNRFEKQLRPLVDAVEAILAPMALKPPPSAKTAKQSPTPVFMADTAETLQNFRKRLMAEITDRQAALFSAVPPPWEYDQHAAEVRRALEEVRFSIHLFDQWQGRSIIDRPDCTYPREQFGIARQSQALPLIWVPPELDLEIIANETQRRFLLECAHGRRDAGHYEFVRVCQNDFIHLILEKLAQPPPGELSVQAGHTYLVDTHHKDQRYAFKLADYLAGLGAVVDFNHESEDPLLSLGKFENAIRRVKNLIIMFGKVAPEWLHARIKLALKAICEQFQCEQPYCLETIWVYRVPSSRDNVALPPLPPIINIKILDNSRSPDIDPTVAGQLLAIASLSRGGQ